MIFDFEILAKTLGQALDNRYFIINEQIEEDITFPIYKTVKVELFEKIEGKVEKVLSVHQKSRMPEYLREECIKQTEQEFLKQLFQYVHTH